MTEINQLERAKLAHKHGLKVQFESKEGGFWKNCFFVTETHRFSYRVHPDDEEKLDAIIWEVGYGYKYAYITQDGHICHYMSPSSGYDLKLIATRDLPAEKPKKSGLVKEISYEEAQLFADLKDFVEFATNTKTLGGDVWGEARSLLERINPKPKRCSSQLPVDTLCEVWDDFGHNNKLYSDGDGGYWAGARVAATSNESQKWEYFKALEQPHPTFWEGGECPVPEWCKFKVWYRDGDIFTLSEPLVDDAWLIEGKNDDIIAYQIMGEKE